MDEGRGVFEDAYAGSCGARATWLLSAAHAPAALASLGVVGARDRLVVCADDFQKAFAGAFEGFDLVFVAEPSADLFGSVPPAPAGGRSFWFVNAIGCRGLRVPDLRELSGAARAAGAVLVVDNTVPSCFGCHPLEIGAQLCLEALDRVGAGELSGKLVAVSVAPHSRGRGRRRVVDELAAGIYGELAERLGPHASRGANVAVADADALAARFGTLGPRMQRHSDHARAIAEYLAAHPAIADVCYPGLAGHPDHAVAAGVLLHGAGPALDFRLSARRASDLIAALPGSFRTSPAGGAATRVSSRDGREGGWLRLFAGTDDPLAAIDALERAIRACAP